MAHLSICASQDDTMDGYPQCDCGETGNPIQNVMWEVFAYAKLMDGFDALEGEEREKRREEAHAQDCKIRALLRHYGLQESAGR
jgi:hypothetical protein